jgi:hypothetical protein
MPNPQDAFRASGAFELGSTIVFSIIFDSNFNFSAFKPKFSTSANKLPEIRMNI